MALLKPSAKGGKSPKGMRGRVPSKRSINLVLVDEDRISIPKAVLGIVLIVALAAAFSKFLVYDRLVAVSEAQAKVNRLQASLDEAVARMNAFGDVETTYAHYTMEGMTSAELSLVDRVDVLDLVGGVLPTQPEAAEASDDLDEDDWDEDDWDDEDWDDDDDLPDDLDEDDGGYRVRSWTVSENVLNIEVSGPTLDSLNQLARRLEANPIVDSCTITTANKATGQSRDGRVWAKLIVYLTLPAQEVSAQ